MGRKKKNIIYQYFNYNPIDNTSKCSVDKCDQIIRGNHGANLLRHFFSKHRTKYDEIQKINTENKENNQPTSVCEATSINVRVVENCTNLVAIHGRPFAILEDKAFKNLISMIPGMKSNLSCVNIKNTKENIQEKAYLIRRKIHDGVESELISLKIDVASIKSRRFLGVNIQNVVNGKIVLRNLAVQALFERNTAVFLKETILLILSRFGITLKQIYSITSDNGTNMLSMSRQLEHDLQTSEIYENSDNSLMDNSDEYDLEQRDEDYGEFERLIRHADSLYFGDDDRPELPKIITVRCAAHTQQLAIRDACKDREDIFETCRQVARALRSPNNVFRLKECNLPQAIIDCPTRWDSTADMIERMLKLQTFITSHADLVIRILNNDFWVKLEEYHKVLTPCRVLSKRLQKEQLIFSDFYLSWLKCILEIEELNTPFAFLMAGCMKTRETIVFENDSFLGAIYLDPRVNALLPNENIERARNHLIKTYKRLEQQQLRRNEIAQVEEVESLPSTSTSALDNFLQEHQQRQRRSLPMGSIKLKNSLDLFLSEPSLPSNADLLQYWETKKLSDPQLYFLSKIVLACPPTQVSVERLFSSLKFVMNNLRMSLKDEVIDDILIIRNNTLYNQ